jgi:membrane glycosyltransferase
MGLFVTASELSEAPEQADMHQEAKRPDRYCPFFIEGTRGFTRAVVIPRVHALHTALIRRRVWEQPVSEARAESNRALLEKALELGPKKLSRQEKSEFLTDPHLLHQLHRRVWELPPDKGRDWGVCQH